MTGIYDDIINLPYPTSAKHPRMPISDRAAIFSPFAALTGHGDAIRETARLTEQKMELDEDAKAELDRRQAVLLEHVKEQPEITVTWFCPDEKKSGGAYVVTTGRLKKVDETAGTLKLADGMTISLDEIGHLQCEVIQGLSSEERPPLDPKTPQLFCRKDFKKISILTVPSKLGATFWSCKRG